MFYVVVKLTKTSWKYEYDNCYDDCSNNNNLFGNRLLCPNGWIFGRLFKVDFVTVDPVLM